MGNRARGFALLVALLCAALGSQATAAPGGTPEQRIATPGSRVEPTVAVDPRDPRHVTVAAIDLRHQQVQATVVTGYDPYDVVFISDDGGRSYRPGAPFPTVDMKRQSANDPTLYWAPDGTLYAGYLSFGPIGTSVGAETGDGVWLARSVDGGRHWSRGINLEHYSGTGPCAGPDKPMVVGDPERTQRVFVVYVHKANMCSGSSTHEIRYVASDDAGRTWSRPRGVGDGFGPSARVTADGSLAIAYVGAAPHVDSSEATACGDGYASTLVSTVAPTGLLRRSVAVPVTCGGAPPSGYGYNGTFTTVTSIPSLEVDRRTGALVIAVASNGLVSPGVVVARSTDRTHWSRQSLAALPDELMAMPQLAGGPGGSLGLLYLASGPAGTYTATLRASADGGVTWGAGMPLASVPSTGDLRPLTQYSAYSIGHYLGLAIGSDGVAHAAWPDVRPDPAQPGEADIWVGAMPIASGS